MQKNEVINAFSRDNKAETPAEFASEGKELLYGRDTYDLLKAYPSEKRDSEIDKIKGEHYLALSCNNKEDNYLYYMYYSVKSAEDKALYSITFTFDEKDQLRYIMHSFVDNSNIGTEYL